MFASLLGAELEGNSSSGRLQIFKSVILARALGGRRMCPREDDKASLGADVVLMALP